MALVRKWSPAWSGRGCYEGTLGGLAGEATAVEWERECGLHCQRHMPTLGSKFGSVDRAFVVLDLSGEWKEAASSGYGLMCIGLLYSWQGIARCRFLLAIGLQHEVCFSFVHISGEEEPLLRKGTVELQKAGC